jgi:hypothetical protein
VGMRHSGLVNGKQESGKNAHRGVLKRVNVVFRRKRHVKGKQVGRNPHVKGKQVGRNPHVNVLVQRKRHVNGKQVGRNPHVNVLVQRKRHVKGKQVGRNLRVKGNLSKNYLSPNY